jgi:hypothetical protein
MLAPQLEKLSLGEADHDMPVSPEVRRTFSLLPIRCLLGFQTLLHEIHYHAVYRHMLERLSRRTTPPSLSITVSPTCD